MMQMMFKYMLDKMVECNKDDLVAKSKRRFDKYDLCIGNLNVLDSCLGFICIIL